ncbi:MAG: xylose isomerase [Bacteroidetes bacterium GWF2_42_66]|nr:MAG: xylose isomerase [Bacteroidetes bacterium GWA2_42_15]OFY01318.1 MAG: xylose isomerase [Bacteroidetes bacterium GWE2_42_39]OFY42162.1 MAG: xylose isomerase [Bacteroidetes bacterium GWF2_42_66]HBL77629.1 xylose isomerase [Prolixibacteraceae bacterium]HCB62758.1 xylose isomerase [Bacteroidales bacterium]
MIKIANAPCSWGALEFELEGKSLGYQQVLSEMVETGYAGTELGDWGFMPSNPVGLKKALDEKNLQLLGAFVPVALAKEEAHVAGVELALKTAGLMFDAGYTDAFIVLADENGSVEERTKNAGRITPEMGLSESQWKVFAKGAEKVAKAVKDKFGMRTVFHHHCGGYVETPQEVAKLMELTDPNLLGLCLDMGHYAFGGGNPVEALKKYYNRIWHVHFKDFDPKVGQDAVAQKYDYFKSVEKGVFCELGKGCVDFSAIVKILNENSYNGWIVVEQDVLPGMGSPKKCAANNRQYIKSLGL